MSKTKALLKKKLESAADLLPYGRDLYLTLMRTRLGITYRNVFAEFDAAAAALDSQHRAGYDLLNRRKATRAEDEFKKLGSWLFDHDYPLAFYTSVLAKPNSKVLEFGGSVGHFFYAMKEFRALPESVDWTIAELPEAVSLGENFAQRRQESQLKFIDSSESFGSNRWDLLLSAGTMQYVKEDLTSLLAKLNQLPKNVLLHNVPVHETEEFFTLQYLGICEVPYKIFSLSLLTSSMNEIGYQLKHQWLFPRKVEIPFNREREILGYMGFYFEHVERSTDSL